jgi:cysteine desulfurase / selenocysteine lyase
MSDSDALWNEFRRQMPITKKWAYFDHAAVAPLPKPSADALAAWAHENTLEGDTVWPTWSKRVEEIRALAARLIRADSSEIALMHSTTEGINLVAEGFPWKAGDNVVTLDNEFPSNQYPWLNQASRGVETRRVPTDAGRVNLGRLAAACDARTRIISVSWVGYLSGWQLDLDEVAELAHSHGALLFVDAIQGLGVFPLNVRDTPIDFLAADGHKWLLGPEGASLFFLRSEHLDLLRPIGVGWNSVVHASDYSRIELTLKPTAARYEGGSPNMPGLMALGPSLELLLGIGSERLTERVLKIADRTCERLREIGATIHSPHDGDHRSGIVSFEMPERDSLALRKHAWANGVALAHRSGKLRVSPHAYQNQDDIERLVDVLK